MKPFIAGFFALALQLLPGQENAKPIQPSHEDGRVRIFVGNSETFEASSWGAAAASRTFANAMGGSQAGTVKLTIATMKQLNDHCKNVVVVDKPDKADLFIRVDHNRGMWSIHEDLAVFNRAGEMVFVASSAKLSRDVKRFCESPVFPQPVKQKKH